MDLLQQSVGAAFQCLPALTAVYLAEASCALTQPSAPLFSAVSRHLLRKPSLDLKVSSLAAHKAVSLFFNDDMSRRSVLALLCTTSALAGWGVWV